MSDTVLPKGVSCTLSFNPHDREDGSSLILLTPRTTMKLREVKGHAQDATARVSEAEFKARCVWLSTLCV